MTSLSTNVGRPQPVAYRKKSDSHRRVNSLVGSFGRQHIGGWIGVPSVVDDVAVDDDSQRVDDERTLLQDSGVSIPYGTTDSEIDRIYDETAHKGELKASFWREAYIIVRNSAPLVVTFFLQYSLVMASLFAVGHLGKVELGAVSVASMTANVTAFAAIQGFATCLDTLCAQAYGSGRPELVGLYFQKCTLLNLVLMVPVVVVWFRADVLLPYIIPPDEYELIQYATEYLRIISMGIPGYILFECGKRFMQAQGIYHASTIVLVIAAPINIFLNYWLVWNKTLGLGFHGAPLAVAITDWLLAILLFVYVILVDGKQCWNGFTWKVLYQWGPLIELAIPGLIMVETEFFAFEVMTLASSYFGETALAAQTILGSIISLAYQVPFALSIAAATRVANFIGAGAVDAAKLASKATLFTGVVAAAIDVVLLYVLRYRIAWMFSGDQGVIEDTTDAMAICAFMHFFDSLCCQSAGILRGQGRQSIGGYLNTIGYYIIGLPVAGYLAFNQQMNLRGLWMGITCSSISISSASLYFVSRTRWQNLVQKAQARDSGV